MRRPSGFSLTWARRLGRLEALADIEKRLGWVQAADGRGAPENAGEHLARAYALRWADCDAGAAPTTSGRRWPTRKSAPTSSGALSQDTLHVCDENSSRMCGRS